MTTKALAKHAGASCSPWRTRKSTSTAKITASSPATRCAFPFDQAEREAPRKALNLDDRPLVLSFGGGLGAAALNKHPAYMLR